MQLTVNGKTITLNEDQVNALEAIDKWYKSSNLFFTLSGPAGSGKTTICKKAIEGFRKPICISAPTHKACKVVAKSTGLRSVTIQSLCGLRPDTNLDDVNDKNFVPKAPPKINDYNLVVIDEGSMLSNETRDKKGNVIGKGILELILTLAKQAKTKILFMGDVYQLPPVNEKISEVFIRPDIEVFQLTKVERQKGSNPLMSIYDAIRSDIHSDTDTFEHRTSVQEGTDGEEGIVFYKDGQEFFNKVMETFKSQDYRDNPNYAKLIAWKNATVKAWNGYIRQNIYGHDSRFLMENEILMSYTHIYDPVLNRNLVTNSAEYKIVNIKEKVIHYDGVEIKVYDTLVEDIDDMFAIKVPLNFLVPSVENYNNFLAKWYPLKEAAIKNQHWAPYYKFKQQFMLMETLTDNNNKLILMKDFDYAYAITTHKSQGSTYKNVFVHEDDLDNNPNRKEANNLKYVAFSRPTNMVHTLSQKTITRERDIISAAELSQ